MTVQRHFKDAFVEIHEGDLNKIVLSVNLIPELIRKLALHLEKLEEKKEVVAWLTR